MTVEIYSDVACPWCYIGKARFERALKKFSEDESVEVVYKPFQLDPQAPTKAVPMLEYLEGRFGTGARAMADRVAESARGEGLTIDYQRGLAINSLDALRLLHLAGREYGPETQHTLAGNLFSAHFAEGRDIGDLETLVDVAAAAGMDRDGVHEYLQSEDGALEVKDEISAAQQLGITAVPTFVFERRYAVQGAQPSSAFLEALETVAEELASE